MWYNYTIPLLVVAVIVGIMKGWLIGFGAVFLSIATALFIAGTINTSPILSYASIPAALLGFVCAIESLRRILKQHKVTNSLNKLRKDGVELLRKGLQVRNDIDKDSWWQEIITWITNVHSGISEVNLVDADNWKLLGTYDLRIFNPTPYSRDLNDKLTQLSVWLRKLEHYVDTR